MDEQKSTVLIFGNNDIGATLKRRFQSYNYNVYLYDYSMNGIEVVCKYSPDIIIVHITKPKIEGEQFCNQILSNDSLNSSPIIIAGVEKDEEIQKGLDHGALDVIKEPLQIDTVVLKARNFLELKEKFRQKDWLFLLNQTFNSSELSDDQKFLKSLGHIITKNIGNYMFGVSDLAHALNLSVRQLYRKISSITNYTPADLIREARLQKARKLIVDQQVKTKKELANKVGYKSTSHFCNAYEERFEEEPDI